MEEVIVNPNISLERIDRYCGSNIMEVVDLCGESDDECYLSIATDDEETSSASSDESTSRACTPSSCRSNVSAAGEQYESNAAGFSGGLCEAADLTDCTVPRINATYSFANDPRMLNRFNTDQDSRPTYAKQSIVPSWSLIDWEKRCSASIPCASTGLQDLDDQSELEIDCLPDLDLVDPLATPPGTNAIKNETNEAYIEVPVKLENDVEISRAESDLGNVSILKCAYCNFTTTAKPLYHRHLYYHLARALPRSNRGNPVVVPNKVSAHEMGNSAVSNVEFIGKAPHQIVAETFPRRTANGKPDLQMSPPFRRKYREDGNLAIENEFESNVIEDSSRPNVERDEAPFLDNLRIEMTSQQRFIKRKTVSRKKNNLSKMSDRNIESDTSDSDWTSSNFDNLVSPNSPQVDSVDTVRGTTDPGDEENHSSESDLEHVPNFNCLYCNFTTTVEHSYHRHVNDHLPSTRPYFRLYCPNCDYTTGSTKYLAFHRFKKHGFIDPIIVPKIKNYRQKTKTNDPATRFIKKER